MSVLTQCTWQKVFYFVFHGRFGMESNFIVTSFTTMPYSFWIFIPRCGKLGGAVATLSFSWPVSLFLYFSHLHPSDIYIFFPPINQSSTILQLILVGHKSICHTGDPVPDTSIVPAGHIFIPHGYHSWPLSSFQYRTAMVLIPLPRPPFAGVTGPPFAMT